MDQVLKTSSTAVGLQDFFNIVLHFTFNFNRRWRGRFVLRGITHRSMGGKEGLVEHWMDASPGLGELELIG